MRKNKKSQMKFLVGLLIVVLGALVVFGVIKIFFSKADTAAAEGICRGSVALREKASIEKGAGIVDIQLVPLMCKIIDKKVPEAKYQETKGGVIQNIGELAARCWWMFGEGLVSDIWGRGLFESDKKANCFTCYTVSIRFTREENKDILVEDLVSWLANTPYTIDVKDKELDCENEIDDDSDGEIDDEDEDCKNLKQKPLCERKGGECKNMCGDDEEAYNKWSGCGRNQHCCVKKGSFVSYLDYIQSYGGEGKFIREEGAVIEKGETYSILYVSDIPSNFGSTFIRNILGPKTGGILFVKTNDAEDYCFLQEDIIGS